MKEYIQRLNVFLADQMITYVKLHNLHWYVHGKGFFVIHPKLEELYDQHAEVLDDVAERILTLGFTPIASLKKALTIGTIKELDDVPVEQNDVLRIVLADYEKISKDCKDIVDMATEKNDDVTVDMFTGFLAQFQKMVWMLKAALK